MSNHQGTLKIVLSTYPDIELENKLRKDELLSQDLSLVEFHPTLLFICRKKGGRRQYDKEPVPNCQMFQQELLLKDGTHQIINKVSNEDAGKM